eukprot:EG_transcript_2087
MAYLFDAGLRVQVISGDGLAIMDRKDSDPYVVVSYDDDAELAKTRVIDNTVNPVWKQWLDLPRPPPGSYHLRFTIWDADIGKDECMGMAEIPLNEAILGRHELKVIAKPNTKTYEKLKDFGSLGTLAIDVEDPSGSKKLAAATVAAGSRAEDAVHLEIISGADLIRADVRGKSDPYVKVFYSSTGDVSGKEVFETSVKQGEFPKWNESCTLYPPKNERSLLLQVWDQDVGPDDFMGQAVVPLNASGQQTLPLQPRPGNTQDKKIFDKEGGFGTLVVRITGRSGSWDPHAPTIDNMSHASQSHPPGFADSRTRPDSLTMGTVDFTIVRALNLAPADRGSADPYVNMQFDGQDTVAARTKTIFKTLRPEWNQSFNFTIPPIEDRHLVMKFSVMDEDAHSRDDFMGMAFLPVGLGMDGVHKLQLLPRPGNAADRSLMKKNHNSLGVLIVDVRSRLDKGHQPMHQSGFESLYVEVLGASDLLSATADPYVTLAFGNRNVVAKTTTHMNDANPIWNEGFHLIVPPEESVLRITVMDFEPGTARDELLGEARVRLKGTCHGDHELVLYCKGKDSRQNIGRIRVRISGKRIYDYRDDLNFEDFEAGKEESTMYGQDFTVARAQPVSSLIQAENEEERTRQLAEMWRGHEATEAVYVALPVGNAVKDVEDARKKTIYEEHRRMLEESEKLRVLQEQQAYELAVQRANFERTQLEEERLRQIERRRLEDLASYQRVSLKLGGGHAFSDEVVLMPRTRTTPGVYGPRHGARSPTRAGYKSPYAQSPQRSRPKPKAKAAAKPKPAPSPAVANPGVEFIGGGQSFTVGKPKAKPQAAKPSGPEPVLLRDSTSLNRPSYCQTDYYFSRGDPRDIGQRKPKGVPFEKMSTGRRIPLDTPFLDAKLGSATYPAVYPESQPQPQFVA